MTGVLGLAPIVLQLTLGSGRHQGRSLTAIRSGGDVHRSRDGRPHPYLQLSGLRESINGLVNALVVK